MKHKIPQDILSITDTLEDNGFEAFIVGGCVRDLLLKRTPNDWDITTNAHPEQIIAIFGEDNTFYENDFGTVGVKIGENDANDTDGIVEITPYRTESTYSNARHPDKVQFSNSIYDDLKRRDFTVNALAYRQKTNELIDEYNGALDINNQTIRAVGDPNTRFQEDALRMMRAIRFMAQLNFTIESDTMTAIANNATLLQKISKERIRDEFIKIVMSDNPSTAIGIAEQLGLLEYIIPELREGIGCEQGKKAHKYDVFEHLLRSLQHAADKKLTLEERLAALLHDIGKPRSRRKKGSGYTFYGHEVVGARMVRSIMQDLRMPKDASVAVEKFVRWHMFFSDPDMITLSAVRRMIVNVGKENIQKLLNIRMCDRIGSGRPTEQPFRFRKYKAMVDEALRDPISVGMLKIDGSYLMDKFDIKPGPRIGWTLNALLELVLDDPKNNTKEFLHLKAEELLQLDDETLRARGEQGKQKRDEEEQKEIRELHKKHKVG